MQPIFLDDPAWRTTFPHRVAPLPDEWLSGLLLRCDEVNGWKSGTSLFLWLRVFKPQPRGFWTEKRDLIVLPWQLKLDPLVQFLSLSESVLLATTYHGEVAHLLNGHFSGSGHVTPIFSFRVCPECIAQHRLLRRILILPQLRCCQTHHLVLQKKCPCGKPLQIFSLESSPFACAQCRLDWAKLLRIPACDERLVLEQKYLLFYELFFADDAHMHYERARYLLNEWLWEKYGNDFSFFPNGWFQGPPDVVSLGPLVSALMHSGYSAQDILASDGPHQRGGGSSKWRQLYESAVMGLFAQDLHAEE